MLYSCRKNEPLESYSIWLEQADTNKHTCRLMRTGITFLFRGKDHLFRINDGYIYGYF